MVMDGSGPTTCACSAPIDAIPSRFQVKPKSRRRQHRNG
jgi:hypothetical protein